MTSVAAPTAYFTLALDQAKEDLAKRGVPIFDFGVSEANGYRLELEALGPTILHETCIAWINYPHNPTGASVDLEYLRRQVLTAREYDILLCADDCYLDLYFSNATPPPSVLQVTQTG